MPITDKDIKAQYAIVADANLALAKQMQTNNAALRTIQQSNAAALATKTDAVAVARDQLSVLQAQKADDDANSIADAAQIAQADAQAQVVNPNS